MQSIIGKATDENGDNLHNNFENTPRLYDMENQLKL